jgi:hypothetical protein
MAESRSTSSKAPTKAEQAKADAAAEAEEQAAEDSDARSEAEREEDDGLDEYEVTMDHTHDGERRKIGEMVRLPAEAGGKMTAEGLVTRRADAGRERAHETLMHDRSTRGISN